MNDANHNRDRRRFLVRSSALVAAAAFATALAPACAPAVPPGPQQSGLTVADVAVGQYVIPPGATYVIGRDANGFYAYSNVCTHQGCSLPAPGSNGVSVCPCHRAQFDSNGDNLAGPNGGSRLADLEHYAVSFVGTGDTAQIVVDTSQVQADRATRAAVPAAA